MKDYRTQNLRNIGLIGHSGSGKTTLTEAILYYTKSSDRFGRIEDGNTISDYDLEEKKRKISISTSILPCEWRDVKINIVDMPGYFDFIGEMIQGLKASDIDIITVSAKSGIKVGTEKAWEYVNKHNKPRGFFINKLDEENSNYEKVLLSLKDKFGVSVVPIQYPIEKENDFIGVVNVISRQGKIYNSKTGKMEAYDISEELKEKVDECKRMLIEAVAETDEFLLEKYFEEGRLSDEEIYSGLIKGVKSGDIAPVTCGSAYKGIGIDTLLEDIIECFPSPKDTNPEKANNKQANEDLEVNINENAFI